jgi:tetratricopeptide (TPR) repeat protein
VQRGDNLSISTELVDSRDNRHLWGEQYNRKGADLLAVQEEIAKQISSKLRLRLTGEEQKRLTKSYTENSEAYQLYLKGRFHWNKYTKDGFKKSIEYFDQAVEIDPNYALAYAGLADSYMQLGVDHLPPKEVFPKAQAYAVKALQLDDTIAEAHVSLGAYRLFYAWDWQGAENELRRAKELNPNYPEAYHFYSHYLQVTGRTKEAIIEIKRGLELAPIAIDINGELGFAYYYASEYDRAIEQFRKTLEMDPTFMLSYLFIGQAYEQKGMYEAAVAELNKAKTLSGGWLSIEAELGCAHAASGHRAEAHKVLQALRERAAREYVNPYLLATIYLALGERDQALAWLEKAYAERSTFIPFLKVEPKFGSLRSDPRFIDLVRRVGLPP